MAEIPMAYTTNPHYENHGLLGRPIKFMASKYLNALRVRAGRGRIVIVDLQHG